MNNVDFSNERELKSLIESLQTDHLRYNQEKLAKKISGIRNERTAELIADLLYSDDAYIRNIAIEILVALGECALKVLKEKVSDTDRNIRKFALDALKHIPEKQSCDIALSALDDSDDNVVEAALEVICCQKYKEAEGRLLIMLEETNSTWIINALIRTFASLESKQFLNMIEKKVFSLNTTDIEKNILVNTYVKSLESLGSARDIPVILYKYSKEFTIDDDSLITVLRSLVIKEDISELPGEMVNELGRILKEHWNYIDSRQLLDAIAAFVKLQMDFFLNDIEDIYYFNKGEDFFAENLFDMIKNLQIMPDEFLYKLLESKEPELVVLGLKLVHEKKIDVNISLVESLCNSQDNEISKWANCIATEFAPNIDFIEKLISRLGHKNIDIRKAAAQKLISFPDAVRVDSLEEVVKSSRGEEGMEALEALFHIDESRAWNYIAARMNATNISVRARLIEIVSTSHDEAFYSFITTMINDPSELVRRKAIKALYKRINNRSLSLLIEVYSAESDSVNKLEIISNLYKFDNDRAIEIIHDAAFATDTLVRLAAVKALSHICGSSTVDILNRMLKDRVEEVREAANEALIQKGVAK